MNNYQVFQADKESIAVLILGGGRGTRLYPLTLKRCKPAVPFAGRYRLVDIALSRCIHAGLLNLHVLTQYNSASLHLHINRTYRFDSFNKGNIQVLAANQAYMQSDSEQWFLGSADAVRKTFSYYKQGATSYKHYLILAGDQLHELDLEAMLAHHLSSNADFTVAATPIAETQLKQYGVLDCGEDGQVKTFVEKPESAQAAHVAGFCHTAVEGKPYWGSMGTYLIKAEILGDILREDSPDFGGGVLPYTAANHKMMFYPHLGFFEDIGTLTTFFDTHISLAEARLPINLYHPDTSLFTYRRELPPAMFNGNASIDKSLVVEGSVLGDNVNLQSSLMGVRSLVERDVTLRKTYLMGDDYYRHPEDILRSVNQGKNDMPTGIGPECHIENAIIDKNCRIGRGCRIGLEPDKLVDGDYPGYSIHKGIVAIPKGSIIPDYTVI